MAVSHPDPALVPVHGSRAALYAEASPPGDAQAIQDGLMVCARYAKQAGYRVVALALDGSDPGVEVLVQLIHRLRDGEFETIFANFAGQGPLVIQRPLPDPA